MSQLNQVRDGRQSKVFLLTFATEETTTATVKGKIYAVTGVASSSSGLGSLEVGDVFVSNAALTLATGDKVVLATPLFLGGATDKDMSSEKATTVITCDKDEAENSITDGKVASSGSVTCYDLIQTGDTAANKIKQSFNKMVTYADTTGVPAVAEGERTAKIMLMFLWDARDLDTSDYVSLDFVPALITSIAHGASYGSGQTFTLNYTGNDSDDAGRKRSYHQFKYFDEFGTELGL